MKVFVQLKNGLPINVDVQNAIDGFEYLDYDPMGFTLENVMSGAMNSRALGSPFVGSIDGMSVLFNSINKKPDPIDFPDEIIKSGLIGRDINQMRLNYAINQFKRDQKPIFIKPVVTKLFDGALISTDDHLTFFNGLDNPLVWVSEKIDIVSEHRAYVHKGKLIHCCNYSGDFRVSPNYDYIDLLVSTYKVAPVSYTIDVAVLKDGRTTVVEFNDFWAIGGYGMTPWDYAEMLKDRYFEIINN
jgi:hypothetical protein